MRTVPYRDVWGPVWPNLAASVIWTVPALWWHHRRLKAHVSSEIAKVAGSGDRQA